MSAWVAGAVIGSSVIGAVGANKANKSANARHQAELEAYYNSPQYLLGMESLDYMRNGEDIFDEKKYLADNQWLLDDEYYHDKIREHWDHYGHKDNNYDDYFIKGRQGLLSQFYDEGMRKLSGNRYRPQLSGVGRGLIGKQSNTNYADKMKGLARSF